MRSGTGRQAGHTPRESAAEIRMGLVRSSLQAGSQGISVITLPRLARPVSLHEKSCLNRLGTVLSPIRCFELTG